MNALVKTFVYIAIVPLISNGLIQPKASISSTLKVFGVGDKIEGCKREKILIVGGGFGGLYAALTLSSIPWERKPIIQLIDKKDRFVFLPLLYELCVGDASLEEVAPTYKSLLRNTNVEFLQGEVRSIDVANKVCLVSKSMDGVSNVIEGDACLEFDCMIVATGREGDLSFLNGSSIVNKFYTLEDCYELRRQLNLFESKRKELGRAIDIVVVGGGYSGVELALNLATKGNVTLVHRGTHLLPGASRFNRNNAVKRLNTVGVQVLTDTTVLDVEDLTHSKHRSRIQTNQKELLADILIVTAGTTLSKNTGVLNSILPRDTAGRIVTGPFLRVKGQDNIFAIGDISRARKEAFPATAQVAMQQASVAAWNVYQTLNKHSKKLLPFRYLDLGEMMTLGTNDATIHSLGGLLQTKGPTASLMRRLIYSLRMPTSMQRFQAGFESSTMALSNRLKNM